MRLVSPGNRVGISGSDLSHRPFVGKFATSIDLMAPVGDGR